MAEEGEDVEGAEADAEAQGQAEADDSLRTARLMTTVELLAEDVKETEAALEALDVGDSFPEF